MSLFDVIKYPISDVPTTEQLEALPPKLLEQWLFNRSPAFAGFRIYWITLEGESMPYKYYINQEEFPKLRKLIEEIP